MRIEPPAAQSQPPRRDDADAPGHQASRRLALLHDLSAVLADADGSNAVCALAAARLGRDGGELSFALAYLLHPDGRLARLAGAAGLAAGGGDDDGGGYGDSAPRRSAPPSRAPAPAAGGRAPAAKPASGFDDMDDDIPF